MITEKLENQESQDEIVSLFVGKCNFYLNQSMKDVCGKLVDIDGNTHPSLSDRRLLDTYAPCANTLKKGDRYLYNAFMCYLVSNLSCDGKCSYTEHVNWENRNLFFRLFCHAVSGESARDIYKDACFSDEKENYMPLSARAKLDIMRAAVLLMRNLPFDFYKDYICIFKELCSAVKSFCNLVTCGDFTNTEKMELLDSAISVCRETFLHPSAIDENGVYRFFRDDFVNHRINYTGQTETDRTGASSLYMGASTLTVKLYLEFAGMLSVWLKLWKKTPICQDSESVAKLYEEKRVGYEKHLCEITASFVRIRNGYGAFYDFYSVKNTDTKFSAKAYEIDAEKLSRNLRLVSRGFDNGMKSRAEAYAVQIVAAVKTSKNPIRLVRTALDKDFPLSEHAYKKLCDLRLYEVIVKHKSISELDKALLCAHLSFSIYECREKTALVTLLERIVHTLLDKVPVTQNGLSHISSSVSLAFVLALCRDVNSDAFLSLYRIMIKLIPFSDLKRQLPEEILASAFFSVLQNGFTDIPENLINDCTERFVHEIAQSETELDREGFLQMCKRILKPERYEMIKCELEERSEKSL